MSDQLPRGWVAPCIEELISPDGVFIDGDWVESKDQDPNGEVRLIQLADVGDGLFLNKSSRFLTKAKAKKLRCTYLKKGDVLVARMPDPLGRACVFPLEGEEKFVTVVDVCIIRTAGEISSPEFLRAAINFLGTRKQIDDLQTGTTRKRISRKNLATVTIPLPPLNEQKRIVAKIEELFSELDAGEESLRRARRQLGVYRQSLLKQAFEGKLTAPWRAQHPDLLESPDQLLARIQAEREARYEQQLKEWEEAGGKSGKPKRPTTIKEFDPADLVGGFNVPKGWTALTYGDVCSVVRNGISQKPSGSAGYMIARISAVRPMAFDLQDYRFIDCGKAVADEYMLEEGDLVFTRYNGARRFVGVCARFSGQQLRLYPDKLIRTRPDLPSLDARFLEIALNCGLSRAWLETKIRTTAGQSGVSGGDVKAMPVPLCSLPEQQEIVRLLNAQFEVIEQNERELDAALKRSEALRQSILKKAFSGQLVAQDPSDEPAAALLQRIRKERAATPNKTKRASQKA